MNKTVSLQSTPEQEVLHIACKVLADGGLVIFPTETTYGAGVDATNPEAVKKLLAYKSKRQGKPLSIAVHSQDQAAQYVSINQQAEEVYKQFLPGPVTVVSHGKNQVAPAVESEFGTLGVRIPDYDLILKLLQMFGAPITATSANASGKKRPYDIQTIFDNISDKQKSLIDLVIDAGTLPLNPPSTVIDTTLSTPVVMRAGTVSKQKKLGSTQASVSLTSHSELETQDIAGKLLLKNWNTICKTGLVVGLNGPLGTGKTVFTKGVAQFLGITDTLTSPTYSYIEEYNFNRHGTEGTLYHLDMWKVESEDEFDRLQIKKLLRPNSILVIEWWEQVQTYWSEAEPLLVLSLSDEGETRKIQIFE